jgi:hypothetical protein
MSWSKKLVIGMVSFMIFITTLGVIMIFRNASDSLVEDDYYEKGQSYDIDYQNRQNAIDDMFIPTIIIKDGISIVFPARVKYLLICTRPSDYHMDRTFRGLTDGQDRIQIRKGELQPGPWLFRVQYSANDKNYLFETQIVMR